MIFGSGGLAMNTDGTAAAALMLLARLGIASYFLASALDKLRGNPAEVGMIASLHLPAPKTLEFLTGCGEVAGLLMIVSGVGTRLGASGLLLFVVFTTIAFLRYWSFEGPAEAAQSMRNAFYANWAVAGGLLLLIVVGPGAWAVFPNY